LYFLLEAWILAYFFSEASRLRCAIDTGAVASNRTNRMVGRLAGIEAGVYNGNIDIVTS